MRRNPTSSFWKKQRVVVTGTNGFFGSHIVSVLKTLHPKEIRVITHHEYDLREKSACIRAVANSDIVIHAAGDVGGIGYNQKFPATLFDNNLLMGVYMTQAAREAGVKKLVQIGTVCSYPKYTPAPFSERNLWDGYPEETNAAYGLAKKSLLVQAQAYRTQYHFPVIYLIPVNLYGPGDTCHPVHSHVIPSLIMKFIGATEKRMKKVVLWGTGLATREFLFVQDAAEAVVLAAQYYDSADPINIGCGKEISIHDLAHLIATGVGYTGEIEFDGIHPDGQPRRLLDTANAERMFGFAARTNFSVGLRQAIAWYVRQHAVGAV